MNKVFDYKAVRKGRRIRSEYFEGLAGEITRINSYNLLWSAVVGVTFLTLLIWLTPFIIKGWSATAEYYALYPVFILFFMCFFMIRKLGISSYRVIQGICGFLYLLLFAGFVLISVFPYPDNPQVYISLYIMIIPVLFHTQPWVNNVFTLFMASGFIAITYKYKPYEVAAQDIFSVIAAVLFSRALTYMVLYIRTENFLIRKELLKEAHTDMLTSLLNRKGCEYFCCEYMERKNESSRYTAMMLDLDNFKAVNDTWGHDRGDDVLKAFADALKRSFKEQKVISRLGGDEFFVLFKNVSGIEEVRKNAETIIKIANDIGRELDIPLGSSIGIVIVRDARPGFETLYKMSDELLYEAKSRGKNRYAIAEYADGRERG